MDIVKGWSHLQNFLQKYDGYIECNLYYNCKTNCYFCDFDVKINKKYHIIYIGCFSKRCDFHVFTDLITSLKYLYSLYDAKVLTPKAFKSVCNGAGAKGWGFIVPDLKYTTSADLHDFMYTIGGNSKDRKWADYIFLWNMKRVTPKSFLPYVYFYAVRMFGKNAFEFRDIKISIKLINASFK